MKDKQARVDQLGCKKVSAMLEKTDLHELERTQLQQLLEDHNQAFSMEDSECGKTKFVEMEINTCDSIPKKQRVQKMLFAMRREVAKQLKTMQKTGVIQPASSLWASPVVVQKKDGNHRFCEDYRELNSMTKPNSFPLPRIDDLLDQLGHSHFFSTLDLASGYRQIRVHSDSIQKTVFITPQGLFEFQVMPHECPVGIPACDAACIDELESRGRSQLRLGIY